MRRGPRLVLLGKQGAGKGTQAVRLAEHFGIEHLSTGELFRAAARAGTAFGLEAKRYMDDGELLPDEIVVGVVEERFSDNSDLRAGGFVLDGFPRTGAQAAELNRVLGSTPLDAAVELDVATQIVLDRLAGRRVCEQCGTTYHVNLPPENPWTCDNCGGRVIQREDDTEDAVLRRLELYERETVPMRDLYHEQGLLITLDGNGDGDAVFKRLVAAIEDLGIE